MSQLQSLYGMGRLAGRLGLAREAAAVLRGQADVELDGVSEEVRQERGVEVHTVTILNKQGSRLLNKPPGRYITCSLSAQAEEDGTVAAVLAGELKGLLPPLDQGSLLLVGLGNGQATPDALGPAVVEHSYATRHAFFGAQKLEGWQRVCTLAPGVLGLTGIETAEVVAGVCSRLRPAVVVAVDALAAAEVCRVGRTVQLADSGICPGSGVGGRGTELNQHALGCPVIALGVPTVVDAASIISGALSALKEHWSRTAQILPPDIDDAAREFTEKRLLETFRGPLLVTPRDIDDLIGRMARTLAAALALAVHPGCNEDNVEQYIK